MNDLIRREDALRALDMYIMAGGRRNGKTSALVLLNSYREEAKKRISELPSANPTIYGYDIEHLRLIAEVLRRENLPPERVAEAITDMGKIVTIVRDEFEQTLRKAVEQCKI